MSLTVELYDCPNQLWDDFQGRWDQLAATALVPSEYSQARLLAANSERTFWGADPIITYRHLWSWVAKQLPEIAAPLPTDLRPSLLAERIKDDQLLAPLLSSSGGVEALSAHLERIEEVLDADFRPTTALEEEIQDLRQKLRADGQVFINASRSALARQAKTLRYPTALIVSPTTWISRQLAGLFKGLSRQGQVHIYLLSGPALAPEYLSTSGLDQEAEIREHFQGRRGGALFSAREPAGEETIAVEMIAAEDQAEAAIEKAARLLSSGAPAESIGISSVVPAESRRVLREAAAELGVPLSWSEYDQAWETTIGTVLFRLAQPDCRLEAIKADLPPGWQADDELWTRALDPGDLASWVKLGEALLSGQKSWSDRSWFQRFSDVAEDFIEAGLEPWDRPRFISELRSGQKSFGQGVEIIDLDEGVRSSFDHLIVLGLAEGQLPSTPASTPFLNPEVIADHPELAPPDPRLAFSALALSPTSSLTLLRPKNQEPSPYWHEARRIWPEAELIESRETLRPRQRLRRAAARGAGGHPLIDAARKRLNPQQLEVAAGFSRFSVTELERYDRCPLGWYVNHFFSPRPQPSKIRDQGSALHDILEALYQLDVEERPGAVTELFAALDQGLFSEIECRQQIENLRWIVDNFSPPAWPFTVQALEKDLQLEIEADGDQLTISGKVDRLDVDQDGRLLIIDYKRSGSYGALQKGLYPLMASEVFQAEVLGFAYLSIGRRTLEAVTASQWSGFPSQLNVGANKDLEKAQAKARETAYQAIAGIRSGQWFTTGSSCPDWCDHYLISRTGQR